MINLKLSKYKYLSKINSPEDLRKLPVSALQTVCDELRDYVIDTITQIGGHFSSGLGVVELTVALHYVYNTPFDKIVFDTGHQGYPHKVLTGRRDLLPTIRQKGGISGFLKRNESEYDAFGAGHASTSISAALGIATARDFMQKIYRVIAVIGDGAMTGGMAYEAMNNCGVQKRDITVILNDNNVSIDANVSALSNYFNTIFSSAPMVKMRENLWELTGKMDDFGDRLRKYASKIEGSVKAITTPGILFEAMGFNYFGPINGHNITKLTRMLHSIKDVHGPVLLHVITTKGKGFAPAENDVPHFHAIGKINKDTGKSIVQVTENHDVPSYSRVFGKAMHEICLMDNRIIGITAAMSEGTGLDIVERDFPDRVIDVGIAEEHAVTYAAGMANEGMIPVVAIYSTFMQRAFDQIYHDCALQNLHLVLILDRAGLVGEDGSTHHGVMDLAYLRIIPNMVVVAPKDEQELRDLLYSSVFLYTQGPVAIRFPRGKALGVKIEHLKAIPFGKWEILKKGTDVAILAVGKTVVEASKAAELLEFDEIDVQVINSRFVKPLDFEMLDEICTKFDNIITVEDGTIVGGFGSAVLEYIQKKRYKNVNLCIHGIPDKFIEHGTQKELYSDLMLDGAGIAQKIRKEFFPELKEK